MTATAIVLALTPARVSAIHAPAVRALTFPVAPFFGSKLLKLVKMSIKTTNKCAARLLSY